MRMSDSLTPQARAAVRCALQETRSLNHAEVGTEHLLLGSLLVDRAACPSFTLLTSLDITDTDVRGAMIKLLGVGEASPASQIPFTGEAKKALEVALRESLSVGRTSIATEHLLLALLRDSEDTPARVLRHLNAQPKMIRNEIRRLLAVSDGQVTVRDEGKPMDERTRPSETQRRKERAGARLTALQQLTQQAWDALLLAQEEARALGHDHVGTEHVVLGLLRVEAGIAEHVLTELGVTLDNVRSQVAKRVPARRIRTGAIPSTPAAAEVLPVALRESLSLGHKYIGTEHLLLALLEVKEGDVARILASDVTDIETIRGEVMCLLPAAADQVCPRGRKPYALSVMR